jgi:hypothetical protein
MSLVWLELLQLMKGRSGVALTQFSSSSSSILLRGPMKSGVSVKMQSKSHTLRKPGATVVCKASQVHHKLARLPHCLCACTRLVGGSLRSPLCTGMTRWRLLLR